MSWAIGWRSRPTTSLTDVEVPFLVGGAWGMAELTGVWRHTKEPYGVQRNALVQPARNLLTRLAPLGGLLRTVLPLLFPLALLAGCPDTPPDDSCFEEGAATLRVTLEADRDDIDTSSLTVTLADCLDSQESGTGAVGDTVVIDAPSVGELVVTVGGTWAGGEGAEVVEGTCTGTATVDPEQDGEADVTVSLVCAPGVD